MLEKIALNVPGGTDLNPVAGMPGDRSRELQTFLKSGVTILFIAATLLTLAFLIWGGIQWITSGGDKAAVDAARKKLTYAIIGLVVVFIAFLIINFIGSLVGVNLLDPACPVGFHSVFRPHEGHSCALNI